MLPLPYCQRWELDEKRNTLFGHTTKCVWVFEVFFSAKIKRNDFFRVCTFIISVFIDDREVTGRYDLWHTAHSRRTSPYYSINECHRIYIYAVLWSTCRWMMIKFSWNYVNFWAKFVNVQEPVCGFPVWFYKIDRHIDIQVRIAWIEIHFGRTLCHILFLPDAYSEHKHQYVMRLVVRARQQQQQQQQTYENNNQKDNEDSSRQMTTHTHDQNTFRIVAAYVLNRVSFSFSCLCVCFGCLSVRRTSILPFTCYFNTLTHTLTHTHLHASTVSFRYMRSQC